MSKLNSTGCIPRHRTCRKKHAAGVNMTSIEKFILCYEPQDQIRKHMFRTLFISSMKQYGAKI